MTTKSATTVSIIMAAARTLFMQKNYAVVTVADIASRANVTKGALYHHFTNKEDLYLQMMHYSLKEIEEISKAWLADSQGHCRERLYHSITSFLQLPTEVRGILRLVRRDINIFKDPGRHELIRAYQKALPVQLEAIIRQGIENGEVIEVDPRLLSWQYVAMVEVALHPYGRKVLGDVEEMTDYLIDTFFDGVAR